MSTVKTKPRYEEATPPGTEKFASQREIASRILCSQMAVGRRIAAGDLKPAHCTAYAQYYASEHLDAHRLRALKEIGRRCAQLKADERTRLIVLFAEICAAENQRPVPNHADITAGKKAATDATIGGYAGLAQSLVRPG